MYFQTSSYLLKRQIDIRAETETIIKRKIKKQTDRQTIKIFDFRDQITQLSVGRILARRSSCMEFNYVP